ncbi:hypothetical protein HETIRDRAFT_106180, partial [Heterobasidion irregulare TC 32-1]
MSISLWETGLIRSTIAPNPPPLHAVSHQPTHRPLPPRDHASPPAQTETALGPTPSLPEPSGYHYETWPHRHQHPVRHAIPPITPRIHTQERESPMSAFDPASIFVDARLEMPTPPYIPSTGPAHAPLLDATNTTSASPPTLAVPLTGLKPTHLV